ncbi:hypothetical protein ACMGD3_24195 [Lysinibacillus sphaericus]|uniref:hypothetical protein n=1 Tax=Lysinibacillus sphaericus TaxID=1421 RepID=UPI003F78E92D
MINALYWSYMSINLYTDSKKLETYNRLHLSMLILLFTFYLYIGVSFWSFITVLLLSIIIGIVFEVVPFIRSSSGDTKMIAISSLYVCLVTSVKPILIPILLFVVFRIVSALFSVSFVVLGMFYISINSRYKMKLKEGVNLGVMAYRVFFIKNNGVLKISSEIPATIAIIVSTLIITFIF